MTTQAPGQCAQNPSPKTEVKPQIQYTQHGSIRRMTATGLSFEQALQLWNACKVVGGAA